MLVLFANAIQREKENHSWLQDAINSLPEWEEYVSGPLKNINDIQSKELGGGSGRRASSDSNDNISNDNDQNIKDIYQKFMKIYQNQPAQPSNSNDGPDDEEVEDQQIISEEKNSEEKKPLEEEVAFISTTYWKSSISYDVDELMKEL